MERIPGNSLTERLPRMPPSLAFERTPIGVASPRQRFRGAARLVSLAKSHTLYPEPRFGRTGEPKYQRSVFVAHSIFGARSLQFGCRLPNLLVQSCGRTHAYGRQPSDTNRSSRSTRSRHSNRECAGPLPTLEVRPYDAPPLRRPFGVSRQTPMYDRIERQMRYGWLEPVNRARGTKLVAALRLRRNATTR